MFEFSNILAASISTNTKVTYLYVKLNFVLQRNSGTIGYSDLQNLWVKACYRCLFNNHFFAVKSNYRIFHP
ncbi:hypothetical protein MtrunA17_Chr7g0246171 [Medicago truncatula]|uniref:Uncharacterized protein n=1 Tax=Medicago truncatula TaxID=3880 RepID=A0A396H0B2_MEDTR|nr:hypothetical protein MtrunA17_Chr7g0246171 [Medicago truncatula]